MDLFQASGEARLLAYQGQQQLATMLAARVRKWWAGLLAWHAAMPGTLPPTEPAAR